ncbi:MAG TPA: hypothetical protein VE825_02765 [Terriglobales bacterium]|nr:hypothetical protein [Terriglobales bacterium]
MRFLAALLLAFVLLSSLALTGCGGFTTVGFRSDMQAVSGTVSSVHVSASNDGGFITFVTLQSNGSPNQFAFCGDNAGQFPMNTSVTVRFNPGQDCNVISVVIAG